MARYTPRADRVERRSGQLLRFDVVNRLQEAATRKAVELAPVSGIRLRVEMDVPTTPQQREIETALRKAGSLIGDKLVREARKISRPTYDTGLFMSNWKAATTVEGTRVTVTLRNPTPYASFVHRSGERGRTVVRTYVLPMVRSLQGELARDLRAALVRTLQRQGRRTR